VPVEAVSAARAADCGGVSAASVQGRVRIRPVAGEGVSADAAAAAAESAAAFWRRQGLVVEVGAPSRAPVGAVLGGTDAERALCAGALAPDAADAEALATCEARFILAPMVDALDRLARPSVPGEVVFVASGGLVAPGSPVRRAGLGLPGLAVVGGAGVGAEALPDLFIDPGHTPVVFLDVGTPRRPGDVWTTPAHELGHALGLPHRDGGEAVLMRPGVAGQRCWPGVSAAEAAAVQAGLSPAAP
jgi:hypothetical protein